MQDTLIIINPAAGKGRGEKVYKKLLHCKNISEDVVIKKTDYPGHATKIARSYADQYKNIIIAGGDGTVNEVMNGLSTEKKLKVAVMPIGTGNDFASNLFSKKIKIMEIVDLIRKGEHNLRKFAMYEVAFKEVEKQTIQKKRFVNALGVGFDGLVAKIVNENKKLSGVAAYVLGVFKALIDFIFLEVKFLHPKIDLRDKHNLLITIGSSKTSGGGFYLSPNASIFEDFLEITVIPKMSKMKILRSLPLALVNKIHLVKDVIFHKTDRFEVSFNNSAVAHCDGEIISDKVAYLKVKPVKHNLEIITFD